MRFIFFYAHMRSVVDKARELAQHSSSFNTGFLKRTIDLLKWLVERSLDIHSVDLKVLFDGQLGELQMVKLLIEELVHLLNACLRIRRIERTFSI